MDQHASASPQHSPRTPAHPTVRKTPQHSPGKSPARAQAPDPEFSARQDLLNQSPQVQAQTTLQRAADQNASPNPLAGAGGPRLSAQRPPSPPPQINRTGLPDQLKSGIETLSGYAMDDVRVHFNSSQPAQLQAHAFAKGTDIHLAPGQEKHLPHEAWHVVQQKQGRVQPTTQLMNNTEINDDPGLEAEATRMGALAMGTPPDGDDGPPVQRRVKSGVVQRTVEGDIKEGLSYVDATKGYSKQVLKTLEPYIEKVKAIDGAKSTFSNLSVDMADGLKAWSKNFYNKSQAYLYEAQKANDFTNIKNGAPFYVALLGTDVKLNPDIEQVQFKADNNNKLKQGLYRAIETKASTSAAYNAVRALVVEGLAQLKKREGQLTKLGGAFTHLLLVVHNDDPQNGFPFTDHEVSNDYDKDINKVPKNAWSPKLKDRMHAKVNEHNFGLPLEIRMEFNGKRYALAKWNPG
ncbi:MAG: DUF4157 domain-containing protein [Bacteroidota bacterium]